MAVDYDLKELMTTTVTVKTVTARDAAGDPSTYSAGTNYSAMEVFRQTILDEKGDRTLVADGMAFIYGTTGATYESEITLSDGRKPDIMSIETFSDENGQYLDVIYFGFSRHARRAT